VKYLKYPAIQYINKEKEKKLRKEIEKEQIDKENEEYKEMNMNNLKSNKEKMVNYKKDLENQLFINRNNSHIDRIESNYQKANSDLYMNQMRKHIKLKLSYLGLSSLIKLDSLLRLTDINSSSRINFIDFSRSVSPFHLQLFNKII
jgi:hypothetical protein